MAYPVTAPVLTNGQSVDIIVQSEANILQGLNELLCNTFVSGLLADTTTPAEDRLLILAGVLNTMACKECTVANILTAISQLLVVDKGIVTPATATANSNVNTCSFCK